MASAQSIIEAGYAQATGNDAGKLASDGELLGRLNRVFQSLFAMAARQRPDPFGSTATITMSGSPPASTLAAATPALTDVIEIRGVRGSSGTITAGTKVQFVSETEAFKTWQIAPCVYQRGLSIISRGLAGDPVATDVLALTVLDSPAALAALATAIDTRFPVRHHQLLATDIALYLDAKDEGRDASQFARLQSDMKTRMMAFVSEYNLKASAVQSVFDDRVPAIPAAAG